ncbi:hypothetical protein F4813DRAFT_390750 [Daldinia decipiens]|uniref:uncharacterized protein n=1 Tax=Daldinia decipiens TaxID=326647 RepID=UPI0020C4B7BA|nr:uncharacterized protein F4813DRAFT_390750 [Daldinia decipiens]KAI1656382.1 hypothetical protein F4813DRAFT_390750 [Daldinia decipiens]
MGYNQVGGGLDAPEEETPSRSTTVGDVLKKSGFLLKFDLQYSYRATSATPSQLSAIFDKIKTETKITTVSEIPLSGQPAFFQYSFILYSHADVQRSMPRTIGDVLREMPGYEAIAEYLGTTKNGKVDDGGFDDD